MTTWAERFPLLTDQDRLLLLDCIIRNGGVQLSIGGAQTDIYFTRSLAVFYENPDWVIVTEKYRQAQDFISLVDSYRLSILREVDEKLAQMKKLTFSQIVEAIGGGSL